jgi:transcriptional regulator with GAF, ATPase, and Fis domain
LPTARLFRFLCENKVKKVSASDNELKGIMKLCEEANIIFAIPEQLWMPNFIKHQTPENSNSSAFLSNGLIAGKQVLKNSKTVALNQRIALYVRSHHHLLLTGERGTGKTTMFLIRLI